jgi:hypothetical protein
MDLSGFSPGRRWRKEAFWGGVFVRPKKNTLPVLVSYCEQTGYVTKVFFLRGRVLGKNTPGTSAAGSHEKPL